MYTSSELLSKVNDRIASLPCDRKPDGLYAPIRYVLDLGGKRIRPVLMLMAYNLYREDVDRILMPAVGLETYHNFTLLHDDLMDRAEVRRGKPCVHKRWDDNTAILSGDNMLVLAYHYMMQCEEEQLPAVLRLFTQTALEIDEGQQYDIDFEHRNDVTEAEYIEMIRLKTSVLLACALKAGALLAGASQQDADTLYRFGEQMGLAFQLQDDYLDVYGDYKVFGKRIGGDILCNKKTFLLINAFSHATEKQRRELQGWITATQYDEEEKIRRVTDLYTEIGVDQMAMDRINTYFDEARSSLEQLSVGMERLQPLWDFVLQLMNRQS